jgi:hypothetical protein
MTACLAVASFVVTLEPVQSAAVLVSHWTLNEGAGGTTSDSAANRTGTLQNGAQWTSGRSGAAVSMDGVNDYISLPALEVRGEAFSILAWVKNSSFPRGVAQRFVAKASDSTEQGTYWMVGQTNATGQSRLRFRLRTGTVTSTLTATTGTLPINTWYHVAATYDGKRMRLFLNGAEVGSMTKTGSLARGSGVPVHMGRNPDGSGYMRGGIDDVRIYSSALTRSEITSVISSAGSPPTNQPPTVSLSGPADGARFAAGTPITVSATADDADGTVSRVRFYDGSALIGTDTSSPYRVSWSGITVGSHSLRAVATDNRGTAATSATHTVTVTTSTPPSSNRPPSVSLTAPSPGASFTAPASIGLSATASDTDGTVARVEFYQGSTRIGIDATSPYSVPWDIAVAGSYSLTAVAVDNLGATTVSSTRDITVKLAGLPTTAVFNPSSNHSTAVEHYVLEVFPAGADTTLANSVATRDLGKPSISNGQIVVDVASTILALTPGDYVATVTAVGDGGNTQSAASPPFTR